MFLSLIKNHTIVLQLLLRPGSSEDNADGCDQFGAMVIDYYAQSSLSSSGLKGGHSLEGQRVSRTIQNSKDLTCILDSVENELHFSSMVSLDEYIRSFVEKEVKKLIHSPEKKLSEVI